MTEEKAKPEQTQTKIAHISFKTETWEKFERLCKKVTGNDAHDQIKAFVTSFVEKHTQEDNKSD